MRLWDRLNFQTKITLVTLGMIVLAVIIGWGGINYSILPAVDRKIQANLWHVADGLVHALQVHTDADRKSVWERQLNIFWETVPDLVFVELSDGKGHAQVWYGDERYKERRRVRLVDKRGAGTLMLSNSRGRQIYEVMLPVVGSAVGGIAEIHVGAKTGFLGRLRWQLFYVLVVVTVVVLTIGFFLVRVFSAMITSPVNRLLHMTHLLSQGRLEQALDEFCSSSPCESELRETPEQRKPDRLPCTCPFVPDAKTGRVIASKEPPHARCKSCEIYRSTGNDELLRLLLAFRLMAVEIYRYRDELRQRYEFEERLLEACPDGIIANDRKGRIILYNKGAEHLLGYSRDEALTQLHVRQLYPGDEARAIKRALLSEDYGGPGVLVDYSTQVVRKDGKIIPIRLSATILYEGQDGFAIVGYFHDLSELQQHINALSEANERLNAANHELERMNRHYLDMLSFVTHELKSPIANGYMSANALRQEIFGPLTGEQAVMVEAICRNLDQCMEMIRHYLDLSRIEKDEFPVKRQPTRILAEVIEPVVAALSASIAEHNVILEVDVDPDLRWLLDPELFRGVFTNLVSNALKYGEHGGRIRIRSYVDEDRCRMEVWNSGPGISKRDTAKLFKKFQRLPKSRKSTMRGTGLGLFITKTAVERHGGKIWVESEEGKWVNFIIELPKDNGAEPVNDNQGRDGE